MQTRPPFMVSYSITTKCNLKCKHCYSESVDQAAPDELSTEEALFREQEGCWLNESQGFCANTNRNRGD